MFYRKWGALGTTPFGPNNFSLARAEELRLAFPNASHPSWPVLRRVFRTSSCLIAAVATLRAEPLSKKADIDFFREVPSRNLKGLATRSDGRLVAGPVFTDLPGVAPADLLWSFAPGGARDRFIVGTGPEGKILEVTAADDLSAPVIREIGRVPDPHVFAVLRLSDGAVLAGTSPKGALNLLRDGVVVARTLLPVDSIFDLLPLDSETALVATGNPGRIYRVDLAKFAAAGVDEKRISDRDALAARGVSMFGQIRDRNVRRIVVMTDGRIAAGSSPRGNIYAFPRDPAASPAADPATGGAPVILQENRDAEVTDLLPEMNGDLFATIIFAPQGNDNRLSPASAPAPAPAPGGSSPGGGNPPPAPPREVPPPAAAPEKFGGRAALLRIPADGAAETLSVRTGTAFYRIARRGDVLVLAGGEQGEISGYDLKARQALTFPGSASAQLNHLVPLASGTLGADRFLVLRNNAPGFGLLDFAAKGPRSAETRRLDLGHTSAFGALRFGRLRGLSPADVGAEIRTSAGSDEIEGWGPWTRLAAEPDEGWRASGLRGRYLRLRLTLAEKPDVEADRATLFVLPQNRRPLLQEYRTLVHGFGIIPSPEPAPPASITLNQLLQTPKEDDRRRNAFLNSSVVPSPGTQLVLWTVSDPDGDNLLHTFSIRRDGDDQWIDLLTSARETLAQFDTRALPEGVYFTRLVSAETAPRPAAERLRQTFETDQLVIDHSAPEILAATVTRSADAIVVTLRGRDRLSLLAGIDILFSNNHRETVEQPLDGVRDGREETFVLEVPLARVANATALEVTLQDVAGNGVSRRLTW